VQGAWCKSTEPLFYFGFCVGVVAGQVYFFVDGGRSKKKKWATL